MSEVLVGESPAGRSGRLSRSWTQVVAALLAALAVVASGCGSGSDTVTGPGAQIPETRSAFPIASEQLTVLTGPEGLGLLVDGQVVHRVDTGRNAQVEVSDRHLVALADGQLTVVDLDDGATTSRACPSCTSVTLVDDGVLTLDGLFELTAFDHQLAIRQTRTLDHVVGPPPEHPADPPGSALLGVVDGEIAVGYLATDGGVRRGPSHVSFYTSAGDLTRSVELDGVLSGGAVSPDGSRLAVAVGGSGGACSTLAVPVIVGPGAEPLELVPDATEERGDGSWFAASDLWWNGPDEVVALGAFRGPDPANCKQEFVIRRFAGSTETRPVSIPPTAKYRLLGTDCSTAVVATSSDEGTVISLQGTSATRPIEGFDVIAWTPPRQDTCAAFPGVG